MSTAQRTSRSIVANRFNQFAALYDPDDEGSLHNPEEVYQEDGGAAVLPMVMSIGQYDKYRATRRLKRPECFYCGAKLKGSKANNLDHILPQSRGGHHWPANLVLSCVSCNTKKANATPAEWLEDTETEIAILIARAERLRSLIEELDLEYFVPTRTREDVTRAAAERGAALEEAAKAADKAPWAGQERSLRRDDCQIGRRWFSIVRKIDQFVLVRRLRGTDVMHYIDSTGFDNNGDIGIVASEIWHPKSADEVVEEDNV